jgi:hypothetical protein
VVSKGKPKIENDISASFKVGLICDSDGKTSNLAKRFRLTALRGNKQQLGA